MPPTPLPSPYLEFVTELGGSANSSSDGNGNAERNTTASVGALRRLQSAAVELGHPLTLGDFVGALTATLPGVTAAKLVLLDEAAPTLMLPARFNGLSPESLQPINVTVRVYDAVCSDGWVWRLSPLDRAAWATNLTAALGGAPSRLAVPLPCVFEPPPSPPAQPPPPPLPPSQQPSPPSPHSPLALRVQVVGRAQEQVNPT